jgi:hypothetical protein
VRDGDAEAQRPHRADVAHHVAQGRQDGADPRVVPGEQPVELVHGVAAALPRDAGQVDGVGDPEVLEGAEPALLDRRPHAQLRGQAPVEAGRDVLPVRALGGRRQPEQYPRPHMVEQGPVRRGRRVVELVDDHDGEAVGGQASTPPAVSD